MYAPPADRTASPASLASLPLLPADDLVPAERSLLASPFFWLGGVASIMVWTGLALAVLRWS